MYVAYPDQPIYVGKGILERTLTRANNKGWSINLGHAGVVLIDPETGKTSYYEYGRYDKAQQGQVRKGEEVPHLELPNAKLDSNGKPTKESLKAILKSLSETAGDGTKAEGAFFEGAKANYEKQKEYAEKKYGENNDEDRKKYNGPTWNCGDFARETVNAGKDDKDKVKDSDPAPKKDVKQIQKQGEPVSYDPKEQTKPKEKAKTQQ